MGQREQRKNETKKRQITRAVDKKHVYNPSGILWPEPFSITHKDNHWSNEDAVIKHLEKLYFIMLK